jgi:2-keto-4-pentenoate hydratase/2-oxohepta-3-ene-1,7-dioic acid hydratase in catechol pathway
MAADRETAKLNRTVLIKPAPLETLREDAMKLATFSSATGPRIAIVYGADGLLFDLASAAERDGKPDPAFRSMLDLMDAGTAALDRARKLLEKHGADPSLNTKIAPGLLLAPVPVPRSIRDFSSFPEHLKNAPRGMARLRARLKGEPPPELLAVAEIPEMHRRRMTFYKGNTLAVVGTDTAVRRPSYSKFMDYELECGAFIGKRGADIPPDKVTEHIFGYALFNDFSARDEQSQEMGGFGPGKGKDFDGGNAIGPWIVTADEMAEPAKMRMTARVNGELWSDSGMADGLYNFADIIAFLSRGITLHPGEFIAAGTVSNGSGLERDRYLKDGDTVELWMEGLGTLRNQLVGAR